MTEVICKRCGWKCVEAEEQWAEIDEGRLVKLPPEVVYPHPPGTCNSPYYVGQALFWNLDLVDPDLPPLRVFFKELIQIDSAQFALSNGDWVKEAEAKPSMCSVTVDQDGIFPEHLEIYGEELLRRPINVLIESLVSEECWPVLDVS